MSRLSDDVIFHLAMAVEDWVLIDTALTSYVHNTAYRELREKLEMQVAIARALSGASQSARVISDRQHDSKNEISRR